MDAIKSLVLSLCVSLIFFGVIIMLCPEGVMKKSFTTFISTAIVAVIVVSADGISSAVSDIRIDFDSKTAEVQVGEFAETVDLMNIEAVESSVENVISEKLELYAIEDLEISVSANISDDNSIFITDVELVCPKGYGAVCSNALSELGLDGRVTEREE